MWSTALIALLGKFVIVANFTLIVDSTFIGYVQMSIMTFNKTKTTFY